MKGRLVPSLGQLRGEDAKGRVSGVKSKGATVYLVAVCVPFLV